METSARYTESQIKTYGFEIKTDLCLCDITIGTTQYHRLIKALDDSDPVSPLFELVYMANSGGTSQRVSLLISENLHERLASGVDGLELDSGEGEIRITSPVELLYFFGPHFGDRYGIYERTLDALTTNRLRLLASACSGSTIYLVLAEGEAGKAEAVLSDLFEIPQGSGRIRQANRKARP